VVDHSGRQRDAERARALHESAEQLGKMGSWEWVPASGELTWSDNHFRLFGLEPGELDSAPQWEWVVARTHPGDQEIVRQEIQSISGGGAARRFEYRIIRADGGVRHLRSTITEIEVEPRRVIGYVQDITELRRAEREIQAHIAVADALGKWESLERSGERLLEALGRAMEFVAGAVWLPQTNSLVPRVVWQTRSVDPSALEPIVSGRRAEAGFSLPGHVWISREPATLDVADDPSFRPNGPAALAGLRGAMALPALKEQEVLAVLEFYSRDEFPTTGRLMQSLVGIGRELGHFLDRRRGDLAPPQLTPRELEVLQLAARGHTAPQIAEELVVSRDTVKTHLRHVYAKLEVNDRAAAVAQALRLGLID
jgi:PAS domain S-box-containing protein